MSIEVSHCQYLFGKEANEIFHNVKIQDAQKKNKFVNRCLDALMRVNIYLLTQKEAFFLNDPNALNNQCHLYTLRIAQIQRTYSQKSLEERSARTQENRFLHLCFNLSFYLAYTQQDHDLLIEVVKKTLAKKDFPGREDFLDFLLSEGKTRENTIQKCFTLFLRDEGKVREKAARQALSIVFKEHMQDLLALRKEESPLFSELSQLSLEDLTVDSSCDEPTVGKFYTFPKLAGVAYLVDTIIKEKFAVAVKVKVLTKNGAAGTIVQTTGKPSNTEPYIVVEAIASDGSLSIGKVRTNARKCPTYLFRYGDFKRRHSLDETCFFCKKITTVDLKPFEERVTAVMKSFETMFYALGTDFLIQMQKDLVPHFENKEKYPVLSKMYEENKPKIKELGLEMTNPKTFSVMHLYLGLEKETFNETLFIEKPSEMMLKERGIL